ncbi:MAG: hypothetical protein ACLR0U_03330 [Enterocloster clostridioformis]
MAGAAKGYDRNGALTVKSGKMEQMGGNKICVWRETNSVTGKKYRNYDSLIQWKGKIYHIQEFRGHDGI